MDLAGGCLCGAVRYTSSGTPLRRFVCHCRDCQRSGGSVFHAGVIMPKDGFTIRGKLAAYARQADSGRAITRKFCPVCGSGIINELEQLPTHVVIKVGTLDDPSQIAPAYELFTRAKMPWVAIGGDIPGFLGAPTGNTRPGEEAGQS